MGRSWYKGNRTLTAERLLVVDDEPEFGEFVRKVAVELGYEVRVTTHGLEFQAAYDDMPCPTSVVHGYDYAGDRRQ